MSRKWYPPTISRALREIQSTNKGVRGWLKNKERLEDACTESTSGAQGHVYIFSLGYDNLYKIGMTKDMVKRMATLRAANPYLKTTWSAMVRNAADAEKALHGLFKKHLVEREIFRIVNLDILNIDRMIDKYR